ncbi:TlpA disulfide reductase family protein [Altibacter sp. HG106]|uniref:TlpA disulfide reductase family protein n=1 Tax=Altibacter sp. HG106 TaxID=3023937 RepID=UPI002350CCA5|nr:TlpA disulfide reductase family protein [Altibacter sp. HG106]MDC7996156.1 TlpA disulfide reductase family protein [Altibacter sp. HG106]
MKRLAFIVCAWAVLASCVDNNVKKIGEAVVEEPEKEVATPASLVTIPSYDFSEFEAKYLQPEDDMTYVINFWATWCKPCIEEMPAFESLRKNYEAKKVKVVLVSLDLPKLLEKQVIPFVEKKGLQSEVILLDDPDANTWIPKVAEEWSGAIPATLIIKGDRSQFYEQSFTYETLEEAVNSI